MNKFISLFLILAHALMPVSAFAATTTFQTDTAQLGRPNSNNKDFIFNLNLGAANPRIRANGTLNKLTFSNDGSIFSDLGGSAGGGGQGVNYLADGDGQSYPTGSWVVTTGTGSADTTNYTNGLQSIKVTAAAQTSKLSQDVTPTTQLSAQNYQASAWVKTSLTNVQVCARVGGVVVQCTPVSSANTWAPYTVPFIGPASGSIGIEVSMTSSGTGTFNAQLAYVGKSVSTDMLSQAQLVGGVKITGCNQEFMSAIGVTTLASMSTSVPTGCVYTPFGGAIAPTVTRPAIKFNSLPPGEYVLKYEGRVGFRNSAGGDQNTLQFTDGTNTARELSTWVNAGGGGTNYSYSGFSQSISYTTAQSAPQFEIYAGGSGAGGQQGFVYGTTASPGVISVYFFPSQQQAGFRADATPASWSGTSTLNGSVTTTSYADITSVTGAVTANTSRNISCSAAASQMGISCPLPRAGNYLVCYNGSMKVATANHQMGSRLVDGAGTAITGSVQSWVNASGIYIPIGGCGTYNASAAATTVFKIQVINDASVALTVDSPTFSVVELDAPMPAPYLVGSVTSNTPAQERVERVSISNPGTPTVLSQSGSWVSSLTKNGTGDITVNIAAGMFSAAPTCVCSSRLTTGDGICRGSKATAATTTLWRFVTRDVSSATDNDFDVICMGPR